MLTHQDTRTLTDAAVPVKDESKRQTPGSERDFGLLQRPKVHGVSVVKR